MPFDWRQLLAFTLAGAGGQAGNLAGMQMQRKREQEQRSAMQPVTSAFANHIPSINVSPAGTAPPSQGGTFDYGGSPVPDMATLAPALAQSLTRGADPQSLAPYMSLSQVFQPKAPEAYTLGEGQTRFIGGVPVASIAKTAADAGGFSLSPGQTRFGPDGKPIANLPAAPGDFKAPPSRTRIEGDKEIFEQINPQTQKWEKISEGPRWAPNKGDVGAPGITDQGVLRREFNTEAGSFETVAGSTVRALEAAKDPSAAGDLALIFNYMKILDPGSVVRETEFATAQNAAGVPERLRAQYNRVVNGERLSVETRKDFVDRARRLYEGQAGQFENKVLKRYKDLASRYGIPAENITQDYRIDLAPYQGLFGGEQKPAPGPQSNALTPEEQQELQALRARFGGR